MKKIVSFQTVYNLEKKHFNRDVGQIGMTISKSKGYSSEIWVLRRINQKNFEIKGQKWIGFKNKFTMYSTLFFMSRKIELIHFYHIDRKSFFSSLLYKIFNPKGKIYIKMDTVCFLGLIDYRDVFNSTNKVLLWVFLFLVDYIGFEDKKLMSYFFKTFPKFQTKYLLTTNGINPELDFIKQFKKSNTISIVGRFGSKQKNNELLLEVLREFNIDFLKNRKINLIGTYTEDFIKKLELLFIEKKWLKKCIIKTGFITDKNKLYKLTSESKIFLHTANYECDTNIQYDAMFSGCFMISTNVGNIKQNYPSKYSIFYPIQNKESLYKSIKIGIKKTNNLSLEDYFNIQKICLNKFTWQVSLKELLNKI